MSTNNRQYPFSPHSSYVCPSIWCQVVMCKTICYGVSSVIQTRRRNRGAERHSERRRCAEQGPRVRYQPLQAVDLLEVVAAQIGQGSFGRQIAVRTLEALAHDAVQNQRHEANTGWTRGTHILTPLVGQSRVFPMSNLRLEGLRFGWGAFFCFPRMFAP